MYKDLVYIVKIVLPLLFMFSNQACRQGCTDYLAENFDPKARKDDGSCIIEGCTDFKAVNYDPEATIDDGSCIIHTPGCMDQEAVNYNSSANTDDGSCYYFGHATFWTNNGAPSPLNIFIDDKLAGTIPSTSYFNERPICRDTMISLTLKLKEGYYYYTTNYSGGYYNFSVWRNDCTTIRVY